MISCHKFSLYISEYIDGELTQEVREEIIEHITYCPECHKIHRAYSRLITFCHHCCSMEVPEQVHVKLWQALQNLIDISEIPDKPRKKATKKRRK